MGESDPPSQPPRSRYSCNATDWFRTIMTAPNTRLGRYSRLRIGDGVEYFLCFKRFSVAYIDAVKNKSRRLPWTPKASIPFSRRKLSEVTCDTIQSGLLSFLISSPQCTEASVSLDGRFLSK